MRQQEATLQEHFKKIPSVYKILEYLQEKYPQINPTFLKRFVTGHLEEIRTSPARFRIESRSREEIEEASLRFISSALEDLLCGSLRKVINATGVVLHTGLGRSPLDPDMVRELSSVGRYCNLEIDLETGRRGERNDHIAPLLKLLTGAEDGIAVNNNAAAVMLMLNTVGRRKEVIISRGELIEIGGSFRLPEVMKLSGCRLREVGTTNKTHLDDYREAISSRTGAILICHPSNYEINGFTDKPGIADIVELGHTINIPVIYDLGSGSLIDTLQFGSDSEPVVSAMIDLGLDLVSFSGDKLLGGPQAGIIVGKEYWVKKCRKNHLLRAIRLDKLMIKCLQMVLTQYITSIDKPLKNEAIKLLTSTAEENRQKCAQFLATLPSRIQDEFSMLKSTGKVGSGAYPLMELDSWVIDIKPRKMSAGTFAKKLRNWKVPVFCYIDKDYVRIDLRTVSDDELTDLRDAVIELTHRDKKE